MLRGIYYFDNNCFQSFSNRANDNFALPKPFGKKNQQQPSKDSSIYDFHDEFENGTAAETPWSAQKRKKDRIKMTYSKKNLPKQKIKNIKNEIEECETSVTDEVTSVDENKSSNEKARLQNFEFEEEESVVEEPTTRTTSRRKKTDTKATKKDERPKKTTTTRKASAAASKKKKVASMKKTVVEKCEASLASILAGFEEKERLAEHNEQNGDEDENRIVQSQESNDSGMCSFIVF